MNPGNRRTLILVLMVAVILVRGASSLRAEPPATLRIGTFDSRFVALAYYRSEPGMQAVRDLPAQMKAAREAKDEEKIKELEAKGPALQNLMHQQVFGNLSIPNVLKTVSTSLPEIAQKAGVSLLVSKWEVQYSAPGIEMVDLTAQIVDLFHVDDATRKMIDQGMKDAGEPVPVEQLLNPME
jgi:Skp family chaperone for outer membrane proteins